MKKKKPESIAKFMKRRNKEAGKVVIPETKVSPADSAGSHKTIARQLHVGIVKPKTEKKLAREVKKRKRAALFTLNKGERK